MPLLAKSETAPPKGFRENPATGLVLPEAESRERQVWTKEEWKLLERTLKMLKSHGVSVGLKCDHPACEHSPRLESSRLVDGSFRLRCLHADRIVTRNTGSLKRVW